LYLKSSKYDSILLDGVKKGNKSLLQQAIKKL
jgi:hypothetical protein